MIVSGTGYTAADFNVRQDHDPYLNQLRKMPLDKIKRDDFIAYLQTRNFQYLTEEDRVFRNVEGYTLLHFCVYFKAFPEAMSLLMAGIDPKAETLDGKNALHFSVSTQAHNLTTELVRRGTDPNKQDSNGISPLQIAVANSDTFSIQYLKGCLIKP